MNKKYIVLAMALTGASALVGCGGTTNEEVSTPEVTPPVESVSVCDENGNTYVSAQAAKDAGLTEAQYGATYCQYIEDDNMGGEYDVAMGNATYTIEGKEITLVNGKFEQPAAPGSASMETMELDENTIAMGDLNGDGVQDDYAGIVMYSGGGSGTFAYLVAFIGEQGTNGVMIGDRVPVDSVKINETGVITVETYERADGEAMVDTPSVQVTKTFIVANGVLAEQK